MTASPLILQRALPDLAPYPQPWAGCQASQGRAPPPLVMRARHAPCGAWGDYTIRLWRAQKAAPPASSAPGPAGRALGTTPVRLGELAGRRRRQPFPVNSVRIREVPWCSPAPADGFTGPCHRGKDHRRCSMRAWPSWRVRVIPFSSARDEAADRRAGGWSCRGGRGAGFGGARATGHGPSPSRAGRRPVARGGAPLFRRAPCRALQRRPRRRVA